MATEKTSRRRRHVFASLINCNDSDRGWRLWPQRGEWVVGWWVAFWKPQERRRLKPQGVGLNSVQGFRLRLSVRILKWTARKTLNRRGRYKKPERKLSKGCKKNTENNTTPTRHVHKTKWNKKIYFKYFANKFKSQTVAQEAKKGWLKKRGEQEETPSGIKNKQTHRILRVKVQNKNKQKLKGERMAKESASEAK